MTIKIGITGHRGRVGRHFLSYPNVVPLNCDILNPASIQRVLGDVKPDLIVHLAGKSNVDYCELKGNQEEVIQVNVRGTYNVAAEAERFDRGVVFVSSDHVFSGKRWFGKYKENDTPDPMNFYGMSKFAAEGFLHLFDKFKVVRTSSLFNGERIFLEVKKMEEVDYPTFLKRSFLYLDHFCNLLYDYCSRFVDMPKILHLAGNDSVSYYQLMSSLCDEWKIVGEVRPRRWETKNDFAPRGHNLGLDTSLSKKLGFLQYSYLDGIKEMSK